MPEIGDRVTIEFEYEGVSRYNGAIITPVDGMLLIEQTNDGIVLHSSDVDRVEWTPAPKPPVPIEVGTHLIATVQPGVREYEGVEVVRVDGPPPAQWVVVDAAKAGGVRWIRDEYIIDWRLK